MTTLDELKAAVEALPENPWEAPTSPEGFGLAWSYEQARAQAWKAAFEWRDSLEVTQTMLMSHDGEYAEVMRLIREKLK